MSYILESIKQAERERKLGQQAPSISIEYTGEHIDDVESNKTKWLMLSCGLVIAALFLWSVTQYFANKDRQYIAEISAQDSKVAPVMKEVEKRDVALKPVSTMHTSNLKSVKVIADEEVIALKVPEEKIFKSKNHSITKPIAKQESNVVEQVVAVSNVQTKPKVVPQVLLKNDHEEKMLAASQTVEISNKQELAEIYSDLAALKKQETAPPKSSPLALEVEEELLKIETVNYVAPELAVSSNKHSNKSVSKTTYKKQHEQAVRSGVPSYGELPYDIQEQIPDFNVSVHMFHDDPSQRRIRINGQMYTEGKSLQQNLALVEITRFGAVFDYQGHLFRLNVR